LLILAVSTWADTQPTDAKSAPASKRQPMTQKTRLYVIRGLQSEIAFARKPFPQGAKGITLHEDGTTTPAEGQLAKEMGVIAVRPGDRVTITNIRIAKDFILFELNGGPTRKKKWYDHIDVGVEGAPTATQTPQQAPDHSRGTLLILAFKGFVPEIAPEALKQMLYPVLDFSSKSAAEAYLDTIPPKAKEAIQNHQVLVGMSQDMVIYAKGRPLRKIRETDERGKPYEEWLYGEPPQDVEFVRFSGAEVVQLKIMKRAKDRPHRKRSGPEGGPPGGGAQARAGGQQAPAGGEPSHAAASGGRRRSSRAAQDRAVWSPARGS
jgi:hypothetical protein